MLHMLRVQQLLLLFEWCTCKQEQRLWWQWPGACSKWAAHTQIGTLEGMAHRQGLVQVPHLLMLCRQVRQ